MSASIPITNAMTIDVEDYFQVQALESAVARSQWDSLESRVEGNTRRALEIFARHGVKATFFTLGWVAERFPELVQDIVAGGHELASHGYGHVRVNEQTPEEFRVDAKKTKEMLEQIGGQEVRGYRAASFSIDASTPWAFEILSDIGYAYSSSVFPIRHDYYGMADAPRFPFRPLADRLFLEIPLTTIKLGGRNWPSSGGGYFRLLPYRISHWAVSRVNEHDRRPGIFYFHPWELDPGQPRIFDLPFKSRFRHYTNLKHMQTKLECILSDFSWDRMDRVFLMPTAA